MLAKVCELFDSEGKCKWNILQGWLPDYVV
jgi:hypothetical protein